MTHVENTPEALDSVFLLIGKQATYDITCRGEGPSGWNTRGWRGESEQVGGRK